MQNVNIQLLKSRSCESIKVNVLSVESDEIDEMWSFVEKKENQRLLWHAIDHESGEILAYLFFRAPGV